MSETNTFIPAQMANLRTNRCILRAAAVSIFSWALLFIRSPTSSGQRMGLINTFGKPYPGNQPTIGTHGTLCAARWSFGAYNEYNPLECSKTYFSTFEQSSLRPALSTTQLVLSSVFPFLFAPSGDGDSLRFYRP